MVKNFTIIGLIALACSSSAFAEESGFYLGAQLGSGSQHIDSRVVSFPPLPTFPIGTYKAKGTNTSGFAGRVFAGYAFNQSYGAELGYARFADARGRVDFTPLIGGTTTRNVGKFTVQTRMVDVLGKFTYPIEDGFTVFGKAGVAYVDSQLRGHDAVNAVPGVVYNHTTKHFRPELAAGAGYAYDEHTVFDLSYAYVFGNGDLNVNNRSYIPSLSLITAGVTYKF